MVKLWIAIALVGLAGLIQSTITEETFDCPKGCRCQTLITSVVMKCKTFSFDNQSNATVSHFEIIQSEEPLWIKESVFAKKGLKHVSSITISNSSVVTIDQFAFEELSDLTDVKITHTNVSNIHPDIFQKNKNLKKLSLAGNPLSGVESFLNSTTIEELDMSYCNLTKFTPKTFKNLKSLTFLDLSSNNIKELAPGSFDALTELVEVRLRNNLLSSFPDDIFAQNKKLDTLDLSQNPISEFNIQQSVSTLSALNLSSCKLKSVSVNTFASLNILEILDLSNNQIMHIHPFAFQTFEMLKTINLADNDLTRLDDRVFDLKDSSSLIKINLDNNKGLTRLPVSGFKTRQNAFNVFHFTCNNCGLEDMSKDTFRTMPAIVTLELSHNKISDVSTGVFQSLPGLLDLDLSHNQISTIDSQTFKKNPNLISLTLSGNPLKALHTSMFTSNPNLQKLDLSNCGLFKLWTLPANPEKLSSLINLNVSNNKINIITTSDIAVTDNLKSLDLSGNPLVCSDSFKALIEYLTNHEIEDTEILTHADMAQNIEELKLNPVVWKDRAKLACPLLFTKEEMEALQEDPVENIDDNYDSVDSEEDQADADDDSDEEDDGDDDEDSAFTDIDDNLPKLNRDSMHLLPRIELHDDRILPVTRHPQYSYLWPILVFIGTALAVLGIVANVILFVIRRRQSMPLIGILKSRSLSKLKKNSGLVYQQLSEERGGPKTPIPSRHVEPHPTVHSSIRTAPESV